MRLLAIDTALAACSAAIFDFDKGVIASETLPLMRGHAEALIPLVGRVVEASGVDFSALDRIVVTVGPGSFTGLRVGVAAARGIALAANKRCVGVTTLRALASPYAAADVKSTVLAVIDARHSHLYFQGFDATGEPLDNPRVISIDELISSLPLGRIHVIGDAANLIESVWPDSKPSPIFTQIDAPDIAWVARLGARAELSHELPKPIYLRAPDAKPPQPSGLVQP
jgi:tRNA threonylcarbamoyl adenosine modification protein YeaZ